MAPKPAAVFRGRDTTMATLKCLACGHDNNVGDEWCSSCSSSLNLRLCSACEAINASDAERCHSCNAEFRIEPEVVTFEMDAPAAAGEPVEAPLKTLPAVWRLATGQARKPSGRSAALLTVLPLLAAGAAYYFYAASPVAQAPQMAPTHVAPIGEAPQNSEPAPDPEAATREPVRPQTAAQLPDVKPAPAPVVPARIAAPRAATASTRGARPPEPKRATAAVTHTRGAGAEMPSRTAAAEAPARTAPVDAPAKTAVTTLPAAAASAPAASAVILPVSERVTHTKADLTESAPVTAAPAATQVRTVPAEARSDEPAGCPPAVAALALCKSR
jgi:hypothetical protein